MKQFDGKRGHKTYIIYDNIINPASCGQTQHKPYTPPDVHTLFNISHESRSARVNGDLLVLKGAVFLAENEVIQKSRKIVKENIKEER